MEKTIRLILVDDHDVVRTGLKTFLEKQPGLQVVGEAGSGDQAIAIAEKSQPGCHRDGHYHAGHGWSGGDPPY